MYVRLMPIVNPTTRLKMKYGNKHKIDVPDNERIACVICFTPVICPKIHTIPYISTGEAHV
jgi:hypothetical protein